MVKTRDHSYVYEQLAALEPDVETLAYTLAHMEVPQGTIKAILDRLRNSITGNRFS